jgi:hypothetical protein
MDCSGIVPFFGLFLVRRTCIIVNHGLFLQHESLNAQKGLEKKSISSLNSTGLLFLH